MNLLLQKFPCELMIQEMAYPIETDFRIWIELNEMLLDRMTDTQDIVKCVLSIFKGAIPEDIEALFEQVGYFLNCGKQKEIENTTRRRKQVFSFTADMDYIVSAFQEFYQIDLFNIGYMHWWKFNLLLCTLNSECELKQRIRYRSIDVSKIKNAKERKMVREIQQAIALPAVEMTDEEIASVF